MWSTLDDSDLRHFVWKPRGFLFELLHIVRCWRCWGDRSSFRPFLSSPFLPCTYCRASTEYSKWPPAVEVELRARSRVGTGTRVGSSPSNTFLASMGRCERNAEPWITNYLSLYMHPQESKSVYCDMACHRRGHQSISLPKPMPDALHLDLLFVASQSILINMQPSLY